MGLRPLRPQEVLPSIILEREVWIYLTGEIGYRVSCCRVKPSIAHDWRRGCGFRIHTLANWPGLDALCSMTFLKMRFMFTTPSRKPGFFSSKTSKDTGQCMSGSSTTCKWDNLTITKDHDMAQMTRTERRGNKAILIKRDTRTKMYFYETMCTNKNSETLCS